MNVRIRSTALALAFSVLGSVLWIGTVRAQTPGVTNQPLARGQTDYAAAVGGPAEIMLARVTLEPGSSSGWHTHPGSGWVVITDGQVSLYGHDGCPQVYTAGAAFLEEAGDIHEARNETAQPAEFFIAFTVPSGGPLMMTASIPSGICGH